MAWDAVWSAGQDAGAKCSSAIHAALATGSNAPQKEEPCTVGRGGCRRKGIMQRTSFEPCSLSTEGTEVLPPVVPHRVVPVHRLGTDRPRRAPNLRRRARSRCPHLLQHHTLAARPKCHYHKQKARPRHSTVASRDTHDLWAFRRG